MLKEKVKYNCHQNGTNAERNDLTEYEPEQENCKKLVEGNDLFYYLDD